MANLFSNFFNFFDGRIFLFLSFIVLGACSKRPETVQENPVTKAYRLVDSGRADEAIYLLEVERESRPQSRELVVALISAYANMAGIKFQKILPAFLKIAGKERNPDSLENIFSNEVGSFVVLNNALNFLQKQKAFIEKFAMIPQMESSKIVYLRHAIGLFGNTGVSFKSTDLLYKALLEVILVKSLIAEYFFDTSREAAFSEDQINKCTIKVSRVRTRIYETSELIIDVYNDLGVVFPEKESFFSKQAFSVADQASSFGIFLYSLVFLSDENLKVLHLDLFKNGFGKLLSCN